MTTNDPLDPGRSSTGDTHSFGDLQVSTGRGSAAISVELIVYVLAVLGVFITSAIVDEDSGPGFSAAQAWFYVTLLTVGYLLNRGLSRINARGDNSRVL